MQPGTKELLFTFDMMKMLILAALAVVASVNTLKIVTKGLFRRGFHLSKTGPITRKVGRALPQLLKLWLGQPGSTSNSCQLADGS